jgi:TRAP transporter 4TM/12TM fusion protein
MRSFSGKLGKIVFIFCVAAAAFHLYTGYAGAMTPRFQRCIHLGFMLPLAFLLYPARKGDADKPPSLFDYAMSITSIIVFCLYIIYNKQRFDWRWQFVDPMQMMDIVCGGLAIILLLEATRRAVAPAMALLATIALGYLVVGPYMPGVFAHKGFSLSQIVEMNYMGVDLEGIFGTLTAISSTFVAVFVIFGSFVGRTSIGDFFNDFAMALTGRTAGGPAKVAVVSSGLFGMVSGIGASNVYTTGTFTIPLMKKMGFKPEFAGAVEACASTGGQYMPPIMGTGAFIMAELTGISYFSICKAAFISAMLFYFALWIMVHFRSLKMGIRGYKKEELNTDWEEVLRKSWNLIPIVVLVGFFALGYSPLLAGIGSIAATAILGSLTRQLNLKGILLALEEGTKNTVLVALACACAGVIISVITHTGLGLAFTSLILQVAKNSLFLSLGIVMLSCIILGMGLPTGAAYVMAATLAVPAMQKLGLDLLACHLFVFYSAIFSELTPPVAICAYVGAQIAKADPTKTGIQAFKLGIGALLLPYIFVTNTSLILKGSIPQIALSILLSMIGLLLVSWALIGYYPGKEPQAAHEKPSLFELIQRAAAIAVGVFIAFLPQISIFLHWNIWEKLA